jgi:glutamyl-tRNA reductase
VWSRLDGSGRDGNPWPGEKAYQASHAGGTTSRYLNKLFQRAFNVAKEVRTNTNITRGSVSIGSVAVELAEKIFGRLNHCHVMILGAGETSEMTAGALQARGVKTIFVANRSHERAVLLAEKMNGRAIHFDEWAREFHEIDILIGSTAAPHHVVTREKLAPIMRTRCDRPLFCIDLAVPRDFDPAVNGIDGVYLYDIDHLQRVAQDSMATRRQEMTACEEIIERHVAEFNAWLDGGWQASLAYSAAVSGGEPERAQT